ncbi:MAG: type II secretion system protein GspL [Pseudomonadota bacterium]|nr:type II secretion system protein GspL [Pseudomonadota bacterium]
MKLLRVRVSSPWNPSRPLPWALLDESDGTVVEGESAVSLWPRHDRVDFVLAASQVRIVPVSLPPLPPARLAAATRFAIEDQIASGEAVHIAVSAQNAAGALLAIVCPYDIVASLRDAQGSLRRPVRVIAEPELAPPSGLCRWCASDEAGGFVRLPDGAAFPVSTPAGGAELPPELQLALHQGSGANAPAVSVEWAADAADLIAWQQEHGVAFNAAPAFRWHTARPATALTDLLQGELSAAPERARPSMRRVWAPAAWLLAFAAALHMVASLAEWTSLRIEAARTASDWQSLAVAVGLPAEPRLSADEVRASLARKEQEVLHAHHRFVAGDALALLARATPAFAELAPTAVRRASYQGLHWTFELEGLNAPTLSELESRLRAAGSEAVVVPTSTGARVRIGAP